MLKYKSFDEFFSTRPGGADLSPDVKVNYFEQDNLTVVISPVLRFSAPESGETQFMFMFGYEGNAGVGFKWPDEVEVIAYANELEKLRWSYPESLRGLRFHTESKRHLYRAEKYKGSESGGVWAEGLRVLVPISDFWEIFSAMRLEIMVSFDAEEYAFGEKHRSQMKEFITFLARGTP